MENITFKQIDKQQLVDLRYQHAYHAGHLKGSINLNPKNFKKFGKNLLSTTEPLIFIVDSEVKEDLSGILEAAKEASFENVEGYIDIEDISQKELATSEMIDAKTFLNKADDDFILLDVRNQAEVTRPAPEKNLVKIAIDDLPNALDQLDASKEIYTLCGSGNSSTSAASYLVEKGYKGVVLAGGMKAIEEESKK